MPTTVAVVGLGTLGLVAVKNLLEEGFDVTGFDSRPDVGGLWQYTPEDKTSVLPTTIPNISTERGSYTDFPFPDHVTSFPSAGDIAKYLQDYVDHFGFASNLRLRTVVSRISRTDDDSSWTLELEDDAVQRFDKVILATGMCQTPHVPSYDSISLFKGEVLHSSAFKRPENFKDKRVLVVGLGNTGADSATGLIGHASEIYLSYKHGSYILPRSIKGKPGDHAITLRKALIQGWMDERFPGTSEFLVTSVIKKLQRDAFKTRPEWRLSPAPSLKHCPPIVSDTIIGALEAGTIQPVPGIRAFNEGNVVELQDGTNITVDVVVWCTGYQLDFGVLDPRVDPSRDTSPAWTKAPGSKGKPLPRLYKNLFSLDYPDSLAVLGPAFFLQSAMPTYDLATMAIAQIWKGNYSLPPLQEMTVEVDEHHAWLASLAKEGTTMPGLIREQQWMAWANDAADTGLGPNLGWGSAGWAFWYRNRALHGLLMDGIYTPFVYRLFDGRRKKWEGAREQILKANAKVKSS